MVLLEKRKKSNVTIGVRGSWLVDTTAVRFARLTVASSLKSRLREAASLLALSRSRRPCRAVMRSRWIVDNLLRLDIKRMDVLFRFKSSCLVGISIKRLAVMN